MTCLTSFTLFAALLLQSPGMLLLTGVSSPEELDAQTIEKFEELRHSPLRINTASQSRLASCGLFSPYQAAAILDYRTRFGDILSITELGLVDGIGPQIATALKEYVSLESKYPPGQKQYKPRLDGTVTARYGSNSYLTKIGLEYGNYAELHLSSKPSDAIRGSVAYYGNSHLGKIVLGAFNARFGQGLTLWSGMSISGMSTTEAFCKKATGISASCSTSSDGAMTGIAADFIFGKMVLSAAINVGIPESRKRTWEFQPMVNACWTMRNAQFSATLLSGCDIAGKNVTALAGGDFRIRAGKTDIFGEFCWDFAGRAPATVLGIRRDPAYQFNWVLLGRCYSPKFSGRWSNGVHTASKTSDEAGGSAGVKFKWLNFILDGAYHPSKKTSQTKLTASASPIIDLVSGKIKSFAEDTPQSRELVPSIRFSERYRPLDSNPWRTDLRVDTDLKSGAFRSHLRWNSVWNRHYAWLCYAEAGYRSSTVSAYLRAGIFNIPDWDDRIYVYERDVQGYYNSTAYYGKGYNVSLTGSIKLGKKVIQRFQTRLGTIQYPWTPNKSPKYEWRVQYMVDF